jgi:hypothetical protein
MPIWRSSVIMPSIAASMNGLSAGLRAILI